MEHPAMAAEGEGVATVLQNHHLAKISDENARRREEHARLDSVRKSLATVTIHYGDHEVAADLARSSSSDDSLHFTDIPRDEVVGKDMAVALQESPAAPVSQLTDIFASRAYQIIGELHGLSNASIEKNENGDKRYISVLILLSRQLVVHVNITGVSDADLQRFEEEGIERLWGYLQTGEEGMFTPTHIQYIVTDEVQEIFDLGPLPSAMKETELPRLERLRRGIVNAIGVTDAQRGVLEDNKALRFESQTLDAFLGILGTVKFNHPAGPRFLGLKGGKTVVNCTDCDCLTSRTWVIDCSGREDLVFELDDLPRLRPMLSGTMMHSPHGSQRDLEPLFGFREDSTTSILMECDNGTAIYGNCDTDHPEGDTEVNLTSIVLPLKRVEDALNALGIDYSVKDDFLTE